MAGCSASTSQIRTVASEPKEVSQGSSGATANAVTGSVWPVRVWRACPGEQQAAPALCGSTLRVTHSGDHRDRLFWGRPGILESARLALRVQAPGAPADDACALGPLSSSRPDRTLVSPGRWPPADD